MSSNMDLTIPGKSHGRAMTMEDLFPIKRHLPTMTMNSARSICMNILSSLAEHKCSDRNSSRKRTSSESEIYSQINSAPQCSLPKKRKNICPDPGPSVLHTNIEQHKKSAESSKSLKKAKHPWQVKKSNQRAECNHTKSEQISKQIAQSDNMPVSDGMDSGHLNRSVEVIRPRSGSLDRYHPQPSRDPAIINPLDHPHLYEHSRLGGLKLLEQLGSGREQLSDLSILPFGIGLGENHAVSSNGNVTNEDRSTDTSISSRSEASSPGPYVNHKTPEESTSREDTATSGGPDAASTSQGNEASNVDNEARNNEDDEHALLTQWQGQHLAKAVVDNAINKTLEELGLSPSPGVPAPHVYGRQRREVETAGLQAAINSRGLRRHSIGRAQRMEPIVSRLTQVSENIFAQNVFVGSNRSTSRAPGNRQVPTLRRSASATDAMATSLTVFHDSIDSTVAGASVSSTPIRVPENVFDLNERDILSSFQSPYIDNGLENQVGDGDNLSNTSSSDTRYLLHPDDFVDEEDTDDAGDTGLSNGVETGGAVEDTSDLLDQAINAAISERGLSVESERN